MMIYAVLSHFDFVAKFTGTNLKKDFINTGGGNFFIKFHYFFKLWLPLAGSTIDLGQNADWISIWLGRVDL